MALLRGASGSASFDDALDHPCGRCAPVGERGEAFQPFWDAYHTINDSYAGDPVDRSTIIQGAIRGMIAALGDPYSSYLTSDEYRKSWDLSGAVEDLELDFYLGVKVANADALPAWNKGDEFEGVRRKALEAAR